MNKDAAAVKDKAALKVQKHKRLPRGQVRVFDNWCKGCGLCIAFCPQEVFEANGEGRPIVAHPERCTACEWCYVHCPDFAIVIERLAEEEAGGQE